MQHKIEELNKQLQQLKVENEKLKQERDLYKTWYRAKHDDLKNFLGKLKAENEKLKQKLEKIKEICAEQKERIEFNDDIDYESFDYILKIIESEN